jgi:nicotinamidase/pyrazinamidase
MRTALIVVDVQNDFCPGGALAVKGGDLLGPRIMEAAEEADVLVATRDIHPLDHCSFDAQGGIWPPHCVMGTTGAEFHRSMVGIPFDRIQGKGTERDRDAYSGFDRTSLADYLRKRRVDRVVICGIATDYCVKATALDALGQGFHTTVLADAVAAVDVTPGDGDRALRELEDCGVQIKIPNL